MPDPTPNPHNRRSFFTDYRLLTPSERSLWRYPLMWAAAIAILFIPLIYAGIYLASVWDPYGHLDRLPVALVNLDRGASARGKTYQLGRDLVAELRKDPPAKFIDYPSEAAAQAAVRRGEVYFALTLPGDFSRKAVAGSSAEHGQLRLYTAPGTSYFSSRVGSSIAREIAADLNRTLGSNRWEVVRASLRDVQQGFESIRNATGQLRDGAASLEDGAGRLASGANELASGARSAHSGGQQLTRGARDLSGGVTRLTAGTAELSRGLRELEAAAPGRQQLQPLQSGAQELAQGNAQLATGLAQLEGGARQLEGGAADLARGATQLEGGAQQLAQKLPQLAGGLKQLSGGARDLSGGAASLAQGHQQLAGGAQQLATQQLASGADTLAQKTGQAAQGAQAAATGATELASGATELASGAAQLRAGAAALAQKTGGAAQGAKRLASGAADLQNGVDRVVQGNVQVKEALGAVTSRLPAQKDLDQLSGGAATLAQKAGELTGGVGQLAAGAARLAGGSQDLRDGAGRLHDGLSELYRQIPSRTEQLGGDPEGLAASVTVVETRTADVKNNGSAFAPYFIALGLWVGATMTTFIFPYLLLPESGRHTGQAARVLRKFTVPAGYVVMQALIAVLGLHLLGVTYLHPGLVVLTVVTASLTFMLLVLALNLLLGAAGRLLAIVLLIVQLGASGGSYPVELSPGFFRAIHAVVPVTDVINALRFAMFGSYEGQYGTLMTRMLLVALLSLVVALLARYRWQFTPDEKFRSPIITDVG